MELRERVVSQLVEAVASWGKAIGAVAAGVIISGTVAPAFLPDEPMPPEPIVATDLPQPADPFTVPIRLVIEDGVSEEWGVWEAVRIWEDATGCDLFTEDHIPGQLVYTVKEEWDLKDSNGNDVAGLAQLPYDGTTHHWIKLDPQWKDWQTVTLHELGHALGIRHTERAGDVMSGLAPTEDLMVLSEAEVGLAKLINEGRCG